MSGEKLSNMMSEEQKFNCSIRYDMKKKNLGAALILCFLLGGLGAHKFYQNRIKTGVLYLIFFWTFIPKILSFIDLFLINSQVKKYNIKLKSQIYNEIAPNSLEAKELNAILASTDIQKEPSKWVYLWIIPIIIINIIIIICILAIP